MKAWKVMAVLTVIVLAFGAFGVGVVFAKSTLPALGGFMGLGWGNGPMGGMMNGGSGMMGSRGLGHMAGVDMDAMHAWMTQSGGMHRQVLTELAGALGMTPDELNAALKQGKTLAQVGEERGVSASQLAGDLEAAMKSALQKAVTAGTLTQAQADAMLSHMAGSYEAMLEYMGAEMLGAGSGGCHGSDADDAAGLNPSSF